MFETSPLQIHFSQEKLQILLKFLWQTNMALERVAASRESNYLESTIATEMFRVELFRIEFHRNL